MPGRRSYIPVTAILAVVVTGFVAVSHASAASITDIDVHPGMLLLSNGYTVDSSGNPVQFSEVSPLLGSIGGDFGLGLGGPWSLRPGLDVYGVEYAASTSGKVVPTQLETADSALYISTLVSSPIVITWKLNESLALSTGFSPTILVRFPLITYGSPDLATITSYMYKDARFLYPEVRVGVDYAFRDWVHFGFTLRALFPVFHFWDGEAVPFTDQMIVSGALMLRFPLHLRQGKGASNASSSAG